MDQTEARYSEIARLMQETGEWIVLQIEYNVPFWAKPPLSTWAAALSMKLLGVHEFAVRLPYFLVCVFIAFWIGRYRNSNDTPYWLPGCILMTLPEFYLHAGVVSTDVFLMLSIVLVMLSFWEAMQPKAHKKWGYLFFFGMGLGVLAKGPIVGILTLPPLLFWIWKTKQWKKAFQTAPWIRGILLFLITGIPWFVIAEIRSPGFIDYFIVGEHFNRYFNSEWAGDKYGFPKQQPLGIIWVFFAAFTLPWFVAGIQLVRKQWKKTINHPWSLFLLAWMLWPLIFFTVSKSLIHPYTLTSMVPFALWIANGWSHIKRPHRYMIFGAVLPLILLGVFASGTVNKVFNDNSDKLLIAATDRKTCLSLNHKSYSSQFYSQGKIQKIDSSELNEWVATEKEFYLLVRHKDTTKVVIKNLEKIGSNRKKVLYRNPGKK